ncbi:MAG: glycosyltransferase family 2 protein [Flavobacteriales bacterium]
MPTISAAIITYNEEKNIRRCLESLQGVADEIVVVDSGSTDSTAALCSAYGVRILVHPFEGHIQQKNYALNQCTGDWILSLDADEALSPELRASVLRVKNHLTSPAYQFNRLTNYCGHWVRYCGWYPDRKVRLVQRGKARWTGVNPHDRLEALDGSAPLFLHGDLLHYSYYTREDHLRQIEYFSGIASRELFAMGQRISMPVILLKVAAQFIKSFILKAGFLDGYTGWTISRLSAFATWRKYTMLLELYGQRD